MTVGRTVKVKKETGTTRPPEAIDPTKRSRPLRYHQADSNGDSQSLPRTHDNIQPRLDLISRTGRPLRLKRKVEGRADTAAVAAKGRNL